MARRMGFLGFPNVIGRPYCTLAAADPSLVPAGMEASYLGTEEPSDKARISSLDPLKTIWSAALNSNKGGTRTIDGCAVVNSNLSPWGRYRIASSITYDNTAPNNIEASTNRTGAVTDIDELISSPDSTFMGPTVTASPWDVRLGFLTPAGGNPIPNAGMGMFVVRVKLFGTVPTGSAQFPLVTATLRRNSSILSNALGTRAVTAATGTGQVLIFPFDPGGVGGPADGSAIELLLSFAVGTSCYAKLDTVRMLTEFSAPTLDSGWILSPASYFVDEDGPAPSLALPYFPLSPWTGANNLDLILADDQVEANPDQGGAGGVPACNIEPSLWLSGYLEAGGFWAGGAIFLARGIRPQGPAGRIITEERGGASEGGQTFGADAFHRRGGTVELLVTRDELMTLKRRIAWGRGHSGAFVVAIEPDVALKYQLFGTYLATLKEMGDDTFLGTRYRGDSNDWYVLPMTLEEKL